MNLCAQHPGLPFAEPSNGLAVLTPPAVRSDSGGPYATKNPGRTAWKRLCILHERKKREHKVHRIPQFTLYKTKSLSPRTHYIYESMATFDPQNHSN